MSVTSKVISGFVDSGSGTRFKSNPKAGGIGKNQSFQAKDHAQHTGTPPPPSAYEGLRTGPESSLEHEQVQALPVDGSNGMLRNLSPFVIQVEMPLVFANDPTVTSGNSRAVGIYEAASRGKSAVYGRGALSNANYLGSLYNGGTGDTQECIAKNAPDPQVHMSGDGAKLVAKDGDTPVGRLGNPTIADLSVAMDIAMQLSVIANTPPLVLLINPSSMNMSWSKLQQFSDRSRHGYVFQAWGEEQPRLSITAKCGAFYSGGRGVHVASRRDSAAWQNLMSLFKFYKNNGYIHDTVGNSNAHHFVGGLSIHYDGWIYYGNLESFSYTFAEDNQLGGVEFNMDFVVSVMVDSTKSSNSVLPMKSPMVNPNDPRYYNTPSQPSSNTISVGPEGPGEVWSLPSTWTSDQQDPMPVAGDPDFRANSPFLFSAQEGPQQLESSLSGFVQSSVSSDVIPSLTSRPKPFGV